MENSKKSKIIKVISICVLICFLLLNTVLAEISNEKMNSNNIDSGDSVSTIKSVQLDKNSAPLTANSTPLTANSTQQIPLAHGTTVNNGEFVFKIGDTKYKNEYERILAEDGFIYGMDWDWFGNWSEGTTSFGDNEITGYKSVYRAGYVERSLYNMKALGYNAVSVWITHDGGGISYDENGLATGINASYVTNLTAFLNSCRKVGIDFVPTLLVHGYASNYGQASNGLSVQQKYYKFFRYYYDEAARTAFLNNVIAPTCEILKNYQDIIPMIDLTVENGTNAVNDPSNGMLHTTYFGTTWENMCKLINGMSDTVKEDMPNILTTVEDVGWENNSSKYNDLRVDVIGRNEYSSSGTIADLTTRYITKPSYLGEYNTSEDSNSITDEKQKQTLIKFLENAIDGGYIGAFYYNWNNEAGGKRCFFNSDNCDDYEAFRPFVTDLCYNITDLKNEYKGITNYNYKPVILYCNGSKDIYFVGGKNVNHFKLERTTNGTDWFVVNENINFNDAMLDNGIIKYTDNTMVAEQTYSYRVTAILNDSSEVVSDPSNEFELFVPTVIFSDSFEAGSLNGNKSAANSNGWYDAAWGSPIGEFSTATARTGSYSLHADYANGIGTNRDYGAKWAYNLELTPGTMYNLSYWFKNAAGSINVCVKDGTADTSCGGYGSVGVTNDNEWHQCTFKFTCPSSGKVRICIQSLKNDATKFYLDDFQITETR